MEKVKRGYGQADTSRKRRVYTVSMDGRTLPVSEALSLYLARQASGVRYTVSDFGGSRIAQQGYADANLIFSVIVQAIQDALDRPRGVSAVEGDRNDALRFLFSRNLDYLASMIDLDGEEIRRALLQAIPGRIKAVIERKWLGLDRVSQDS